MKRILIFLLVITLLASVFLSPATAANDVCFIAINDTLLELSVTPHFYGSAYVPYTIFGSFSIYSTYFASGNTVSLYRADKQLYFDMDTGKVYDGYDNYYYTSTMTSSGSFYVPLQFVCNFFGLNWSYVEGIGYGDILRINDGTNMLSDRDFLYAATDLMKSRYEAYKAYSSSQTTAKPESSEATDEDEEETEGEQLQLSFTGADCANISNTLALYSTKAAFYLTPDEIFESPDLVRQLVGQGHSVGILCSENIAEDYARGSDLLFDATGVRTYMISSSYDCHAFAEENSLVCHEVTLSIADGTSYSQVVELLKQLEHSSNIRLTASTSTENIIAAMLSYLRTNGYTVIPEREI